MHAEETWNLSVKVLFPLSTRSLLWRNSTLHRNKFIFTKRQIKKGRCIFVFTEHVPKYVPSTYNLNTSIFQNGFKLTFIDILFKSFNYNILLYRHRFSGERSVLTRGSLYLFYYLRDEA